MLFYANNNYIARNYERKRKIREMIKYDKLWETMKAKGISQYDLYTHYQLSYEPFSTEQVKT